MTHILYYINIHLLENAFYGHRYSLKTSVARLMSYKSTDVPLDYEMLEGIFDKNVVLVAFTEKPIISKKKLFLVMSSFALVLKDVKHLLTKRNVDFQNILQWFPSLMKPSGKVQHKYRFLTQLGKLYQPGFPIVRNPRTHILNQYWVL